MGKRAAVVGLGETGRPLMEVLSLRFPGDISGYDPSIGEFKELPKERVDFLNICVPWGPSFVNEVLRYKHHFKPDLTIIHSTVPVGTTSIFDDAVHSPILGRHGRMIQDLITFKKWIGGERAARAAWFLEGAGFQCVTVEKPEETELMKLMCLAKFGVGVAFAFYQKDLCEKYGVPYEDVRRWDEAHNEGVEFHLRRPILEADPSGKIGGHCVIPGTRILNHAAPSPLLGEVLRYG